MPSTPPTGQVKAMWSSPSFDPSPLASFETKTQKEYWESLDPEDTLETPLLNIATSRGYPPGSTFKVVTAAAALESGEYSPTDTDVPRPSRVGSPADRRHAHELHEHLVPGRAADRPCTPPSRSRATRRSRSSDFEIFPEIFDMAEALGFNERSRSTSAPLRSLFPDIGDDNLPSRAKAAIGQQDVVATPLQMALVAATVANDGEVPRPRTGRTDPRPVG